MSNLSGHGKGAGSRNVPGPDPAEVHTLAELAQALAGLRALAGLSLEDIANPSLAKSTASKLCTTGRSEPETLRAYVQACGAPDEQIEEWIRARARAYGLAGDQPAGTVRVSAADPLLHGVHRAIRVPGTRLGQLPAYVQRDIDLGQGGVRATLAAAANTGGFVVLVGGSSVGKTRCLFEAVTQELRDWWLLHPKGTDDIERLAQSGWDGRVVVWLDDLQYFLDAPHTKLSAGTVRALLQGPARVVLAATIWPEHHARFSHRPDPDGPDTHADARLLLELAHTIWVPDDLSKAERARALVLADTDPQIAAGLAAQDSGFTQAIAAAPDLVRWWQTTTPYARAVTSAAFHAARLGIRGPLPAEFLEAAAPGYCSERDRVDAPQDWFETAMADATGRLRGAASPLIPHAGPGMHHTRGYSITEYLQQTLTANPPAIAASFWDAAIQEFIEPDQCTRLAIHAKARMFKAHAISFFRRSIESKTGVYDSRFPELLLETGQDEELRKLADAGDMSAALVLCGLLSAEGRYPELRQRADAGDPFAAQYLANAEAGNPVNPPSPRSRAGIAKKWQQDADAGDSFATSLLDKLLAGQGRKEELKQRAGAGDMYAERELANLRAYTERESELQQRADAGDIIAAQHLAAVLIANGREEELQRRANAGDSECARSLSELIQRRLAKNGRKAEADQMDRLGLMPDGSIATPKDFS